MLALGFSSSKKVVAVGGALEVETFSWSSASSPGQEPGQLGLPFTLRPLRRKQLSSHTLFAPSAIHKARCLSSSASESTVLRRRSDRWPPRMSVNPLRTWAAAPQSAAAPAAAAAAASSLPSSPRLPPTALAAMAKKCGNGSAEFRPMDVEDSEDEDKDGEQDNAEFDEEGGQAELHRPWRGRRAGRAHGEGEFDAVAERCVAVCGERVVSCGHWDLAIKCHAADTGRLLASSRGIHRG